jgi:hypothetical protein
VLLNRESCNTNVQVYRSSLSQRGSVWLLCSDETELDWQGDNMGDFREQPDSYSVVMATCIFTAYFWIFVSLCYRHLAFLISTLNLTLNPVGIFVIPRDNFISQVIIQGPGWRSRYADSLRTGRSSDRVPMVTRFSVQVELSPETHPPFSTTQRARQDRILWTGTFMGCTIDK